jgi:glutaredoxin
LSTWRTGAAFGKLEGRVMKTYCFRALLLGSLLLFACGNPVPPAPPADRAAADPLAQSVPVTPPFTVASEAEGLLLVWYDETGGAHAAARRGDVPEANRARVRVDSLEIAPEQRLDPAYVYVADLRKARADGSYEVRKVLRDSFESAMAKAAPETTPSGASASSDVIIYGASWCGACKQAARYFSQKGVPFVEKDIEKEPGARGEMMQKAKAQGVSTSGIPVIDVRGTLLGGFDPRKVDRLLAQK